MTKREAGKKDRSALSLMHADYLFLFVFQITTIISIFMFAFILYRNGDSADPLLSITASSILGSQLMNARKLYKAAISSEYTPAESFWQVSRIGTVFFYIVRPIFAAVVAVFIYLFWLLSIDISTGAGIVNSIRFDIMVILLGFCTGISAGKIIEGLEERSVKFINQSVAND